ncbi:FAD binding domain-containing protein [Tenuifilum thalassicum]|uniref:2Fe-2S iron-sulfur cluster binding domain-containing protein n=1 Tax=Tenuifilum thalassicum TaxID=2590900 RepID=A0A7D3XVS3_9BACT|nr:FAD binding domain-containing protein [Tenuifilum thalassicum]QKG80068.1 2Fe-2S iron-sulfur cluster binding domain-containing protein [Tenuifilum thalassicum]
MINFILNENPISTSCNPGMSLLDFIRYEANLPGTKVGCREGDCGACTVLIGELADGKINYYSVTSCLYPIINVHGKHVVTIEGINLNEKLTPVQQAMADNAATQCGFCTPGFIMSFTGFCLNSENPSTQKAVESVAGNICRCTGYKSIERAAADISNALQNKDLNNPIGWLVNKGFLPKYFTSIPEKLKQIKPFEPDEENSTKVIAGGTDLMVQQPDKIYEQKIKSTYNINLPNHITISDCTCTIGGATTVNHLLKNKELLERFPKLDEYLLLVSSEPIRNMASVAGNIVNASPIGDLSVMLLALNAQITTINNGKTRQIPLNKLFIGYKQLDLEPGELIQFITFELPKPKSTFSFEKVSKRKYLDIASVNTALLIEFDNGVITKCRLSAGGVAPYPLYLEKTSTFMNGNPINKDTIANALELIDNEISPISDIRGTAEYKRLLLKQLFKAHLQKVVGDEFEKLI